MGDMHAADVGAANVSQPASDPAHASGIGPRIVAIARSFDEGTSRVRVLKKGRRVAQVLGVRGHPRFTDAGAPSGVPAEDLEVLCEQLTGAPIRSVVHRHLSGWKESGAFLLRMTSVRGSTANLICKVNDHRPRAIAALEGFPVAVGPSEPLVLQAGSDGLRSFLPELYFIRTGEGLPTVLYLEALGARWHTCTALPVDIVRAARAAARLQGQLDRWHMTDTPTDLIAYDRDFAERLNAYLLTRLSDYASSSGDVAADGIVRRWGAISQLYLHDARGDHVRPTVVHGDFNTANVFIGAPRRHVKVIDWEWAGVGDGYRDLAALLKRSSKRTESRALEAYHSVAGGVPAPFRYERLQIERGLLDAAFLSVQLSQTEYEPRMNLRMYIDSSLRRVLRAEGVLTA